MLDDRDHLGETVDMFGAAFDAYTSRSGYALGIDLPPTEAEHRPTMPLDQFEAEAFTLI